MAGCTSKELFSTQLDSLPPLPKLQCFISAVKMSFFTTEKQVQLLLLTTFMFSCSGSSQKCSKPSRAHYIFSSTPPPTGRYGSCSPSTEETHLINNFLLIRNTLLLCRYLCCSLDCQPYLASINVRFDTSNLAEINGIRG